MICKNCGNYLEDGQEFCPYCGMQNVRKQIQHRNFWTMFLLSLITCGIYGIWFWYKMVEDINEICDGDGKKSPNYIIVLLLTIVTCGIYGIYWWYRQVERLYDAGMRYHVPIREKGLAAVLWIVLAGAVGSYVVEYMVIDNMNLLAMRYNGEKTEEEIYAMGKNHPYLVPVGVVLACIVGILTFIVNLNYVFSSEMIQSLFEENEKEEINIGSDSSTDGTGEVVPDDDTFTYSVTIVNQTGGDIWELYSTSVSSDDWGEDILGYDMIMENGDSIVVDYYLTEDDTVWDFLAVDEQENELEYYDVNLMDGGEDGATLILEKGGYYFQGGVGQSGESL